MKFPTYDRPVYPGAIILGLTSNKLTSNLNAMYSIFRIGVTASVVATTLVI